MTSAPVAVSLEGVSFGYNEHLVLEEVTFEVFEGDFFGVIGPNGSGKTTMLKIILGLLKPLSGRVQVFGRPPGQVRSLIGYVPQHAHTDRLFPVSVTDVVLMGRLAKAPGLGRFSRADRQAALEALAQVEMADLAGQHFGTLSGGQRQRVLIARALAGGPRLLVLDEPTSSVDSRVEEGFFALLKKLNQTATIILVSHDLGFVSTWVNRVACVNRRVAVHRTAEITKVLPAQVYREPVRMVQHICEL